MEVYHNPVKYCKTPTGHPKGTPMLQNRRTWYRLRGGNMNSTSLESRSWLWQIYRAYSIKEFYLCPKLSKVVRHHLWMIPYWECWVSLSNRPNQQIQQHPTRLHYPLITYLNADHEWIATEQSLVVSIIKVCTVQLPLKLSFIFCDCWCTLSSREKVLHCQSYTSQ